MLWHIFTTLSGWEIPIAIAGFLVAILLALSVHEWAHAWAAHKSGDDTAKIMGRMTLNPAKHVEPAGALMFLFVGIGWARPVPVNPFNYRNFRRGNFFVSIAGITTNFIMGFFASLFFFLTTHFGDTTNLGIWGLGYFFMLAMVINFSLMIFNLLPIYPLDGYNALRSITRPDNRYMKFAREKSQILLIVVLLVMVFTGAVGHMVNGISWLFYSMWSGIAGV